VIQRCLEGHAFSVLRGGNPNELGALSSTGAILVTLRFGDQDTGSAAANELSQEAGAAGDREVEVLADGQIVLLLSNDPTEDDRDAARRCSAR
jgi:hypothetical protein